MFPEAGIELDVLVAEKVLGYEVVRLGYLGTNNETLRQIELESWFDQFGDRCESVGLYGVKVEANLLLEINTVSIRWSPSTDMRRAWELVLNAGPAFRHLEHTNTGQWLCYIHTAKYGRVSGLADTAEEAICIAAIMAARA